MLTLRLNKDVLFLIVKELQNDIKSLHSCLLVDRNWCETTIPVLWKNPLKFCLTDSAKKILFNVILLHLSEKSRENLKSQKIDLFTETYQRPLFNYISFWRYLDLYSLEMMIYLVNIERIEIDIVKNEIWNLFINGNTKFTHLYLKSYPYHQIRHFPGVEHCFSNLKFLQCNNDDKLEELARITKSVEALDFIVSFHNKNSGIIKFIEAQKNLTNIRFIVPIVLNAKSHESFFEALEESLIKHANTIQYLRIRWNPITKLLSYLVNLISLELRLDNLGYDWSYLENVSLPVLKILMTQGVPYNVLVKLIENTKESLTEISFDYFNSSRIGISLIQAIYQNCPSLQYVTLIIEGGYTLELERLLINCQHLNVLDITFRGTNWDDLFNTLTEYSPTSLFKFSFVFVYVPGVKFLKLFFDNWKGRHPMLLQISVSWYPLNEIVDLIENYKAVGIIRKYNISISEFGNFKWFKENDSAN